MRNHFFLALTAVLLLCSCSHRLKDGEYTLTVLSTDDVHGSWFDSTYAGGHIRPSLMAMNYYIDSVRKADGFDNVLLVDAGDCLQGDNAAYYYNYIDTLSPHLFPRLMAYMQYDCIAMGNHDIETGHSVYDRVQQELEEVGLPFLAGNIIRTDNGKPYFPLYKIVHKAGLKIAVLGYNNANIKAWLGESVWSGMDFIPIRDVVQRDVDYIRKKEKPDVVVLALHSASGQGDGTILEAEALDVLNSVKGADWVICGHDHLPRVEVRESAALLNSGSHSRFLAHGKMHLSVKDGEIVSKSFEADLIPVDPTKADPVMREHFRKEFEEVRSFTLREVGVLNGDIRTRDAYAGMCNYINLLHYIALQQDQVQLSLAAPLTFNGYIPAGILVFNDLFTIYPFENQLYVVTMTGDEFRRCLEASYDRWIQDGQEHVLRIVPRSNARTQQKGWSFAFQFYNFDSGGGVNYTVDVTRPLGERVQITSLADGTPFDPAQTYRVGLTSYRASGGGHLLDDAGIDTDRIDERIVARYPEIRNLLYDYLMEYGSFDPEIIGDPAVIGAWQFIPEKGRQQIQKDMELLFGK